MKDLDCKSANETQPNALEIVALDKLVQINTEQLKGDAQVVPKVERFIHAHNVIYAFWVLLNGGFPPRIGMSKE